MAAPFPFSFIWVALHHDCVRCAPARPQTTRSGTPPHSVVGGNPDGVARKGERTHSAHPGSAAVAGAAPAPLERGDRPAARGAGCGCSWSSARLANAAACDGSIRLQSSACCAMMASIFHDSSEYVESPAGTVSDRAEPPADANPEGGSITSRTMAPPSGILDGSAASSSAAASSARSAPSTSSASSSASSSAAASSAASSSSSSASSSSASAAASSAASPVPCVPSRVARSPRVGHSHQRGCSSSTARA